MAESRFSNLNFPSNDSDAQSNEGPLNVSTKLRPVHVGKETRRNVPIFTPLFNPSISVGVTDESLYFGDDDKSQQSPMKPVNSAKPKKKLHVKSKASKSNFHKWPKLPDVLAFFEHLTGTFHRPMLCFGNVNLLKATVRRGLQAMLDSLKFHEGNRRREMSYSDMKIYFVCDSLFEISWNYCSLDRIHSLDFQKKLIIYLDGTSLDPGLASSYEVVPESSTSDKAQHTSHELKFSEFQYMLYKLILPSSTNGIYQHFSNGRSQEEILTDCKFTNNFIYEYASAVGKYTMGLATLGHGSLQTVQLDLSPAQLDEVLQYSLPLYAALLLHLHDAVNHMTNKVSLLPIPDYVRLRLVFELTVHIYFETVKSRREFSQNSTTLQEITNNLHMAVRSVISTEPTKVYFLNLREDHKCLSLLQCIFSQIRFSHTLRNYFESVW